MKVKSPMTPEEEKALGIYTINGMKFDKDGNMLPMTRPELQKYIMSQE